MVTTPLADVRFSLVGPGKVGKSLSAWARAAGAELVSISSRGADPREERTGSPDPALGAAPWRSLDELATAGEDLLLLAVPDDAVAAVAGRLAGRPQARVALHTAGALDAAVLAPLRKAGCAVGTLHPLKAFPRPLPDPTEARGIFFALDGDPAALALGERLAAAWQATSAAVPAASRGLYHLAASLAAGGIVTLLAAAGDLARSQGLPPEVARGYLALAQGALAAAGAAGDPAAALTGPVARGDLATLTRQWNALAEAAPERLRLVLELARETLRQVSRPGPASDPQRALLAEIERRLAGG